MIYLGIDPGDDGALGLIKLIGKVYHGGAQDYRIQIYKCPKTLQERRDLLESIVYGYGPTQRIFAAIEKASKIIRIGKKTYHSTVLWGNYQAWLMALLCFDIPHEIVPARRWQKILEKNKKLNIKERAWEMACRLYPEAIPLLKGKHGAKKFGHSDALIIAEWARRNL